ncbi:MAG: ribosome small subunit-dependent GTPase A [Candidatus Sericytochromatia bacterium]|nr:ribosome small subunit-dependent GTPase A [Candidatus Sericytochromatia bacterium]
METGSHAPTKEGLLKTGVIVSHQANFYYVLAEGTEYACHMRGNLKKSGESPLVGDRVQFVLEPVSPDAPLPPPREGSLALEAAIAPGVRKGAIVTIAPRKQALTRPAIANVDLLLIVLSADSPPFSHLLLDKFLVAAHEADLVPVIVVNKRDLVPPAQLDEMVAVYRELAYHVIPTEATPQGVQALMPILDGKLSVLAGPSGVGKSSLVNALIPGLSLRAGDVSSKLQRGRHTTRHAALYAVDACQEALLADTPGFSFLSLEGLHPARLGWAFPEIARLIPACRFPSCLHQQEPDCAVKDAPEVAPQRYENYLKLLQECLETHRESADRTQKSDTGFKSHSRARGQEGRVVRVDATLRARDRKTIKQQLESEWQVDLDDSDETDSSGDY